MEDDLTNVRPASASPMGAGGNHTSSGNGGVPDSTRYYVDDDGRVHVVGTFIGLAPPAVPRDLVIPKGVGRGQSFTASRKPVVAKDDDFANFRPASTLPMDEYHNFKPASPTQQYGIAQPRTDFDHYKSQPTEKQRPSEAAQKKADSLLSEYVDAWEDISKTPTVSGLSSQSKLAAKQDYFNHVIAPQLDPLTVWDSYGRFMFARKRSVGEEAERGLKVGIGGAALGAEFPALTLAHFADAIVSKATSKYRTNSQDVVGRNIDLAKELIRQNTDSANDFTSTAGSAAHMVGEMAPDAVALAMADPDAVLARLGSVGIEDASVETAKNRVTAGLRNLRNKSATKVAGRSSGDGLRSNIAQSAGIFGSHEEADRAINTIDQGGSVEQAELSGAGGLGGGILAGAASLHAGATFADQQGIKAAEDATIRRRLLTAGMRLPVKAAGGAVAGVPAAMAAAELENLTSPEAQQQSIVDATTGNLIPSAILGALSGGHGKSEGRRPADAANKDGLPIRTGENVGLSAGMSKDNVTSMHDGSRPEQVLATHTDENGRRSKRPFNLLESTDHHERVEKSQLDAGHTYSEAHRTATEAEHGRMRQLGFDPNEIEALQKPYIDQAAHRARALGNTTPEVTGEPYQDSGENAMRTDGGVPDPRFVLDRDGEKYTEPMHGKLLESIEIVTGKRGDGSFAVMNPHSGAVFSRGRTLQQAREGAELKARNLGRLRLQKRFDAEPPLSQQQLRERYKELYPEARIGGRAELPAPQMLDGNSRELEDAQAPTRPADGPAGDARPPGPPDDAVNRAPEQGAHSFPGETTRGEQPASDQPGDEATASAANDTSPDEERDDETDSSGRVIRSLGKLSRRLLYMGRTPSKYSKTGREALERMRLEGKVRGEGPLLKGNPNNLYIKAPDGTWHFIDDTIDMAHIKDAVTWWNNIGRFFGAKAKEVRDFMLDAENYILLPRSSNRTAGAKLGQTERYLPPALPTQTTSGR